MELNDWCTFFYKNRGKCPECGNFLVPFFGCIGWLFRSRQRRCSIYTLSNKSTSIFFYDKINTYLKRIRKSLAYKDGKRNLDIQRKKTYFKAND